MGNCQLYVYTNWTFCVQIGQLFESSESLNFRRNSKSATFSFKNDDLSMLDDSSKPHCTSKYWPIWMQKVTKEAWRCDLPTSMRFLQKYFVLQELCTVKNSFSKYIFSLFCPFYQYLFISIWRILSRSETSFFVE